MDLLFPLVEVRTWCQKSAWNFSLQICPKLFYELKNRHYAHLFFLFSSQTEQIGLGMPFHPVFPLGMVSGMVEQVPVAGAFSFLHLAISVKDSSPVPHFLGVLPTEVSFQNCKAKPSKAGRHQWDLGNPKGKDKRKNTLPSACSCCPRGEISINKLQTRPIHLHDLSALRRDS